MSLSKFSTPDEHSVLEQLSDYYSPTGIPPDIKCRSFPLYVRRQDVARFLVRHELFKLSMRAMGSIVECGVYGGGGLASWMHFSAIYEPVNMNRQIIGFDTFSGFPMIDERDGPGRPASDEHLQPGGLNINQDAYWEIKKVIAIHDQNRFLTHLPKVELVRGDACETLVKYSNRQPALAHQPALFGLRHSSANEKSAGVAPPPRRPRWDRRFR